MCWLTQMILLTFFRIRLEGERFEQYISKLLYEIADLLQV